MGGASAAVGAAENILNIKEDERKKQELLSSSIKNMGKAKASFEDAKVNLNEAIDVNAAQQNVGKHVASLAKSASNKGHGSGASK